MDQRASRARARIRRDVYITVTALTEETIPPEYADPEMDAYTEVDRARFGWPDPRPLTRAEAPGGVLDTFPLWPELATP